MDHVVAVFIVAIMPWIGWNEIQRRRAVYSDSGKEKTYVKIHLWYVLMVLGIGAAVPIRDVVYPKYALPIEHPALHVLFIGLAAWEFLTAVLPAVLLPYSSVLRDKTRAGFDEAKLAVYPVTERQQRRFLLVAVTVGISEEIIFRGFLYNYLQDTFSLLPWTSFLLVTVYFAAGHFHQGTDGVLNAAKLALIMGYLFFATGSLLVPILVHIAYDMKIVWVSRALELHKRHRPEH